jgi:hypothetical protein
MKNINDLVTVTKKILSTTADVAIKGKDVLVSSKKNERKKTKSKLEEGFKKLRIPFKSVLKPNKSSSVEVLEMNSVGVDIIFKPIKISKSSAGTGLDFEDVLKIDLDNYFKGAEINELNNKKTIELLERKKIISRDMPMVVIPEGSRNTKRKPIFNGGKFNVPVSTGAALSDITLENVKTKKRTYLSLKTTKSFYLVNTAVKQYFLNPATKVEFCEYFGIDGQKMASFGSPYKCVTKPANYPKVAANIQEFLSEAYGTNLWVIHKKTEDEITVDKIGSSKIMVRVSDLGNGSYVYPERGVRKYAMIRFHAMILGHRYEVDYQFRGTTAIDTSPTYLRILIKS